MLNLIAPGQSEKLKQLIMLGPKATPTDELTNTIIKLHVYEESSSNELCTHILAAVSETVLCIPICEEDECHFLTDFPLYLNTLKKCMLLTKKT